MLKPKAKITRKAGFMLLEASLALIVASLAGAYALNTQLSELKDIKVKAQADAMTVLQAATNAYVNKYFQNITHNGAGYTGSTSFVHGGYTVADMYNPTIADLNNLDVGLPPGYSPTALVGGNYKIKLTLSASCNPTSCPVSGIVWIDQPLLDGSAIDYPRLGLAMQQIGADAAFSSNLDLSGTATGTAAAQLHGYRGSWVDTNPQGTVAGIMAVRTGASGMLSTQYLRIDGSNQMTGNLQVGDGTAAGNHDIVNLRDIVNARDISNSRDSTTGRNITAGQTITSTSGDFIASSGNVKADNGTVQGKVVMATGGGGGNGQTYLQNYGMQNDTGNINILPKDNGQVIIRPTSGVRNGSLITDFANTVLGDKVTISANDAVLQNAGTQNIQAGTNLYLNPFSGGPVVVGGRGGTSGLQVYGTERTLSNSWGLVTTDGSGSATASVQNATASLNVNDIYLRSIGKWATQLGSNGSYIVQGAGFAGWAVYSNTSASTWAVTASGGTNMCGGNGFDLQGYVNGGWVAGSSNNNPDWAKSGSITFFVPAGSTFYVTSSPWSCGFGSGQVSIYQM